jgi:Chalcone isomerase-like
MKKIIILFSLVLSLNNLTAQTVINGVTLPAKIGFSGTVRYFVGGGYREQFFVRPYVLGLYMQQKSTNPQNIINDDKPMSIRLQITSIILTSELMEQKIRDGFSQSLKGNTKEFTDLINLICTIFSSEPVKMGDTYMVHYTPNVGISATKNGKAYDFAALSTVNKLAVKKSPSLTKTMASLTKTKEGQSALPGLAFKKALFGIWFSDKPVDEELKNSILGLEE